MKSFFALCFSFFGVVVSAQDLAPDSLVKKISDEVVSIVKLDKAIQAGNQKNIN